jgi:hypothetical protein
LGGLYVDGRIILNFIVMVCVSAGFIWLGVGSLWWFILKTVMNIFDELRDYQLLKKDTASWS